jgi:serine/threonine-protein kinase
MTLTLLNNRYHLLATVAGGGMAIVYKAQDRLLNRIVAVKVLRPDYAQDPAFLDSFRREAQAAANLTHPNIVTIFDVGQDGGYRYIVMEYVEGRDLKSLIQEEAPFSINRALDITTDVCAGVGFAHRAGIVHCDIKPQNVIISPDGRVKVTDFGIARAFSHIVPTEVETVWGTPQYFAPEQAAGEPPTPASDVYSIGIMLYEMLSGRLPFEASDHATLAMMHIRDNPPPLHQLNPQVSLQLEQIVNKVLSKEPASRYRSADHLGRIIAGYRTGASQVTGFQPVTIPSQQEPAPPPPAARTSTDYVPAYEQEGGETDWRLWFVAAVAALAVLGLIPLWTMVYRTYADLGRPTPTPAVTPLVTPIPGMAVVPRLVGLPLPAAQEEVGRSNLGLIIEERDDSRYAVPTVLDQDPPAGQTVPVASQIKLVVSKSLPSSAVPDVLGYAFAETSDGLKSRGWQLVTESVWSGEPEGQIIKVEPPIGTVLAAGETLTLTLSAGTEGPIPIGANLNNMIALDAVQMPNDRFNPGESIPLVLRWRALQPVADSYTVFLHLIGPNGALISQDDHEPREGEVGRPTNSWTPGVIIADTHRVEIPSDVGNGVYQLRTGMYLSSEQQQRLPVLDAGRTSQQNDSILILEIQVGR